MFLRPVAAFLCIVFCSAFELNAQKGAINSPTLISYGLGYSHQAEFATGFGLTSSAHVSVLEFLRDDGDFKSGFKVRDILGGHCNLGFRMHPDSQIVNGYPVTNTSKIWYDVGFDYAGLEFIYAFKEDLCISLKGQLYGGWNNAAYYEVFSSTYSTNSVTFGTQAGPVSAEIGEGWEAFQHHGPNYFTLASAFRYAEKDGANNMLGFRFISHKEYNVGQLPDGSYITSVRQKSFSFSIFYAHSL